MLKPPLPGMTDTLEFVKQLWGGMQVPGAIPTPNLSVDELDKKIADLKAVESWLNLNLGMLRGSIQALEIQRGTLATLRAMGDSMAQAMQQTGTASDAAMASFAQYFAQTAQAAQAAASASAVPPQPAAAEPPAADAADAADASSDAKAATGGEEAASSTAPDPTMTAALAWWNLLQDQFRQAVNTTMPAEPTASAAPEAEAAPSAPAGNAGGGKPNGRRPRSKVDKA